MKRALTCLLIIVGLELHGQTLLHPWSVVDNGGGKATSSSVTLHSSAGQPSPGRLSATGSVLEAGYLPALRHSWSEYGTTSIAVAGGWNLVSLPLLVGDARTSSVFPTALSFAFEYSPGFGYDSASALAFGRGYWLKFPSGQSVPLVGLRKLGDTVEVSQGWNLIGSVSGAVDVGTIIADPPGIIQSPFYGFSSAGYGSVSTIEPGRAVWVKVSQSGTLRLTSGAQLKRPVPSAIPKQRDKQTTEIPGER